MEWRKSYLDLILVPLGFMINIGYHVWLWHTQPLTTIIGTNAAGRRLWVYSMMKDDEKKNILAVQSLRNALMGSTLMATTSILLCSGLAAVISSTYSVKKPLGEHHLWRPWRVHGRVEIRHSPFDLPLLSGEHDNKETQKPDMENKFRGDNDFFIFVPSKLERKLNSQQIIGEEETFRDSFTSGSFSKSSSEWRPSINYKNSGLKTFSLHLGRAVQLGSHLHFSNNMTRR